MVLFNPVSWYRQENFGYLVISSSSVQNIHIKLWRFGFFQYQCTKYPQAHLVTSSTGECPEYPHKPVYKYTSYLCCLVVPGFGCLSECPLLHCTQLQFTALYMTVLYTTVQYCTLQHCTLLYFTALHITVLYSTVHYTLQQCT